MASYIQAALNGLSHRPLTIKDSSMADPQHSGNKSKRPDVPRLPEVSQQDQAEGARDKRSKLGSGPDSDRAVPKVLPGSEALEVENARLKEDLEEARRLLAESEVKVAHLVVEKEEQAAERAVEREGCALEREGWALEKAMLLSKTGEAEALVQQIPQRLPRAEAGCTQQPSAPRQTQQQPLTPEQKEAAEIRHRDCTGILYGFKGAVAPTDIGPLFPNHTVLNARPLGKPTEPGSSKPVPIMLVFASCGAKIEAFHENRKKLKEQGMSLNDNLTPKQKATRASLQPAFADLRQKGKHPHFHGARLYFWEGGKRQPYRPQPPSMDQGGPQASPPAAPSSSGPSSVRQFRQDTGKAKRHDRGGSGGLGPPKQGPVNKPQ